MWNHIGFSYRSHKTMGLVIMILLSIPVVVVKRITNSINLIPNCCIHFKQIPIFFIDENHSLGLNNNTILVQRMCQG